MPCASDRKFSKTFVGDFTFDLVKNRSRYPLFLNRNIMRVLDQHEKKWRSTPRSPSRTFHGNRSRPTSQLNLANPPPRSTRLRDQLIEKFHQENAELIFDIRSIRRKLNYRENLEERPRKRIRRQAIECRCYFAVWDNREGHRQLEPILKRSEGCFITPADTASETPVVEIELENCFRIPATEFFVPILQDGEVAKWAIGDRYLLEVKIIPCQRSELWPPMPILSRSDESLARGLVKREELAFTEGMLVSNYTNLPHAPSVGVPLNLAFDQGGRTFKTKYGLEVKAEWAHSHVYEAKMKKEEDALGKKMEEDEKTDPLCLSSRRGSNGKIRRSSPAKPQEPSMGNSSVSVSFIWDIETKTPVAREFRTIFQEGLYCPVCDGREFPSLKRLQFHFTNNHDKYRFSIESLEQDVETDALKCVAFRVQVAEVIRARAANNVKDEREFNWQRPQRSFDLDAYINGEHSWVGALPRRRIGAAPAAAQSVVSNSPAPTMSSTLAGTAMRKDVFRPATEVPELPFRSRKRHQVPVAKTIKKTTFYRSINHRPIKTGDVLSETDEEVDESWLVKRHQDMVLNTGELTGLEKKFRVKWNTHVMSEGCPSARYISDSLIRFVRANKTWLRGEDGDVDMFIEFQKLTAMLLERNFIDARVFKDCLQMIRHDSSGSGDSEANESHMSHSGNENATIQSVHSTTIAADFLGGRQQPVHDELAVHDEENARGAGPEDRGRENQASDQITTERDKFIASGEKRTVPEDRSNANLGEIPQHSEGSLENKPANLAVSSGFCATCKLYIARPKRNALTCSTLACPNRGIFHHINCLGSDLKISLLGRRMFKCKDYCLASAPF